MIWKLSRFHTRSMAVVKALIRQKAVTRSRTSEARYTSTNQASGGVSMSDARIAGTRQSSAWSRTAEIPSPLAGEGEGGGSLSRTVTRWSPPPQPSPVKGEGDVGGRGHALIEVQADSHCE